MFSLAGSSKGVFGIVGYSLRIKVTMNSNKQPQWTFGIFLVLFWVVALLGTVPPLPKSFLRGQVTLEIKNNSTTTTETYSFGEGTALQLLRAKHAIQLYQQNDTISCIDGLCNNGGTWIGFLNGNELSSGVRGIWLSSGDRITFSFQEGRDEKP